MPPRISDYSLFEDGILDRLECPNCGKLFEKVCIPTGLIEVRCRGCHKYVLFEFPTATATIGSTEWWGGNAASANTFSTDALNINFETKSPLSIGGK